MFSITTDGWSNIRLYHLVNFIIIIPGRSPFFMKAVDTKGVQQTGENIASQIIEIIDGIGYSRRLVAVVTDNAACMKNAWDIIEEKYPWVYCAGCSAHDTNLLIKDICKLPDVEILLSNSTLITKFIKHHTLVAGRFKNITKTLRITRGLSIPVDTRWFTQYNSANNLKKQRLPC